MFRLDFLHLEYLILRYENVHPDVKYSYILDRYSLNT